MNSPLVLVLASVVVSTMRHGCDGTDAGTAYHIAGDSVAVAKELQAVCRVGERGGDGTLIAPDWVLTAAHVAEGMYRRGNGRLVVYFDNGAVHPVKQVFLHPLFEPMGRYDIALLQLEHNVADVVPMPCYTGGDELGRTIVIAGHGDRRNPDGTWLKDGRLRAFTNIIDAVDDTRILFDYDAPGQDATMQEGTSGPGDSGGPALLGTPDGLVMAGISSMGEPGIDGPCSYGAVEHFVRVSRFVVWIDAVMRDPDGHAALTLDVAAGPTVPGSLRGDGTALSELGTTARDRAVQRMVDALAAGGRKEIEAAIGATYDPAILARRDARTIMVSMPALVAELSGARLVGVVERSSERISLRMEKDGLSYGLDIFFLPSDRIEQMAFGAIG